MAKCIFKTATFGYAKDEVCDYILKMSAAAEKEVQTKMEQIDIYKEEVAKLKKKIREKDAQIKILKASVNENAE